MSVIFVIVRLILTALLSGFALFTLTVLAWVVNFLDWLTGELFRRPFDLNFSLFGLGIAIAVFVIRLLATSAWKKSTTNDEASTSKGYSEDVLPATTVASLSIGVAAFLFALAILHIPGPVSLLIGIVSHVGATAFFYRRWSKNPKGATMFLESFKGNQWR